MIKESGTQDTTLITTTIHIGANNFATLDEPSVRSAKTKTVSKYHLHLINPSEGLQITMKTTSVVFKEPLETSFHERFYGKNEG